MQTDLKVAGDFDDAFTSGAQSLIGRIASELRDITVDMSEIEQLEPATLSVLIHLHKHMHMRVMGHGRVPAVQHGGDTDARAKMLGIGGDFEHCCGRGLEQDAVNHGLVLIGDLGDGRGQREHHVEIGHGQQLRLALGEPFPRRSTLTLWAVPVAATIERDDGMRAAIVLATRNVAAKRRRAAALDGTHHFQLPEADMTAVGMTPSGTMIAENIRDLQRWPGHAGGLRRLGPAPLRPLLRAADWTERALDGRDPAGGNARVARRRIELVVAENRLD